MTDEQIKEMVDRFLRWQLPEDFSPDGGISFDAEYTGIGGQKFARKPTGTNLFTATQANGMIRHMLGGA